MKPIDWSDYQSFHADRHNLLVHLIAVPMFAVAFVAAMVFFLRAKFLAAAIAIALSVLAMLMQRRGHASEINPPRPFSGPANFLRRWFTEQYLLFPMFLLTGRWWRQFENAAE